MTTELSDSLRHWRGDGWRVGSGSQNHSLVRFILCRSHLHIGMLSEGQTVQNFQLPSLVAGNGEPPRVLSIS
jgi:hypothetical protein